MFQRKKLSVMLSALAVTAFSVPSTFAQDADDKALEEVIVTGSRLNTNPNLDAPTPVLTIDAQELNNRGTLRVEDLVNVLPQVFPGQAGEVSNGSTGIATLNLRGVGSERTLSLIDGRRLPYGSSQDASANLDLIPAQLVERVDLQTGGASAVYGSDAIGGVANFIMKRDFEGFELDIQGGFAQADNSRSIFTNVLEAGGQPVPGNATDGENFLVSLTMGANTADGKGNVTLFASYENQEEIVQADRMFSACTLGADEGASSFGGFGCVGSANFRLFGGPGGFGFQQEDGTITPFAGGAAETFNFGATNFFQRPNERFNIYTSGIYEFSDKAEVYAKASYIQNESDAQIAPTASFGIGAYTVNCDNPFIQGGSGPNGTGLALRDIFGCNTPGDDGSLPSQVSGVTASHRNVEGGERNSRLENSTLRLEAGFRGEIADHWSYDVFGQFSKTEDTSTSTNDFVIANLNQAFLVTTDASGNPVCVNQAGGCVPYNIFQRGPNGESLVTQEALDYIQGVGIVNGETEQLVLGGTIQTDLGEFGITSPWSDAGIGVLFGFEYREDRLDSFPDEISQIPGGGFTGVGGATLAVSGEIDVTEFFFETQIPIVTDRKWAQELTLNAQYRYSDYSASGNGTSNDFDTDTYGLSLNWTPIEDVRMRGQYQRAVRAPNVIELYEGQDQGLPNLNTFGVNALGVSLFDPCASAAPIASFEQCARTGVTADQFGNILDVISGQTQSITGGNPDLEPESSDTVTFGIVVTPTSIPNLTISLDYFDIQIDDFINDGIPAQVTFNNCLNTGDPTFCDLIIRPPSGSLAAGGPGFGFVSTNLNIAELNTSGFDLQINYQLDAGNKGSFNIDYAATIVDEFDFTPFPNGEPIECAGFFGNACAFDVTPEYRHRLLVDWATPWNFDTSLTWRFYGSVDNINGEDSAEIDRELDSTNYFDLSFNFNVGEAINVRAGVLNLFDEEPPVSVSSGPPLGNGNTYPTIYDTGRYFFAGFKYSM